MSTIEPIDPSFERGAEGMTPRPADADREPAAALLRMIWGIHISRCVYAVAEFGIADLLAGGPVSSSELARATGTHEPSLYRVLRMLAALGVFEEHDARTFGLTVVGEYLRRDAPGSMRSWATFREALGGVRSFEHIVETVMTGKPGFDIEFGQGVFEFVLQHPDAAAIHDAAMSERTAALAPSVADTYDFSDVHTLVDVGGGKGTLLAEILRRHPHLHGVLLEIPPVAARAGAVLDAIDADRWEVVAGDFFARVPEGADCYVMANVLHDWDDPRAIEILSNCRGSMATGGRVLIVERLIPEDGCDPVPTLLSDINMLVITGGQERTNAEYGRLLEAAGLRLGKIERVTFPYGVIEGFAA
jgi:O-methyltransferase domain